MGIKIAWKVLVALGLVVMIRALSMDTSVAAKYGSDRIHNLSLASQQQSLLLTGGFLFMGGIVLLGVTATRRSRRDAPSIDTEELKKAAAITVGLAGNVVLRAADGAKRAMQSRNFEAMLLLMAAIVALILGAMCIALAVATGVALAIGTAPVVMLPASLVAAALFFGGGYFLLRTSRSIRSTVA